MGVFGMFGKSKGKSSESDADLEADRARMMSAKPAPLQTDEQIAHVRAQMEAELEAQRAKRAQTSVQNV
jgi:SPT2 chromatin protein